MGTDERTTQFDALCVEGQGQDRHRLHFFYHARFSRPPIGFEVIPEHEKMYRTQPYSIGIVPQIEWFLVGALIFLSVLAWAEVLRFIFVQSFGGSTQVHLPTQLLFASTLSLITIVLIILFRKKLGLASVLNMSHFEM